MASPVFLTAEWRHLVMINYEVDPAILMPYVPIGTQLDLWNGKAYVSLVGFMFLNTQVLGLPVPFHRNFEEINLRFYVKYASPEGSRRGVVFIKEIVPRWGIAMVARYVYNENYVALPMRHKIVQSSSQIEANYEWKLGGRWNKIGVRCQGDPEPLVPGSDVEFITEHYWGYTVRKDGETAAYEVQHPHWRVWQADFSEADVDVAANYGAVFAPYLAKPPASAFLAEGSEIQVFKGQSLKNNIKK